MISINATSALGVLCYVAICACASNDGTTSSSVAGAGPVLAGSAGASGGMFGGSAGSPAAGGGGVPAGGGSLATAGSSASAGNAGSAGAAGGGTAGAGGGPTCAGELCPADITFYAFGDCQYGGGPDKDKNVFQITAINSFAGTLWPEGMPSAGTPVAEPRGVMLAGDITNSGRDGRPGDEGTNQLGRFLTEYGLTGKEGMLRYPVYEGYGNHDYDPLEGNTGWRQHYTDPVTPSIQKVIERNESRIGLTNSTTDGGHYSWDWGGVHFVNTNLFPGNETSNEEEHAYLRDPYHSLQFLKEDLEAHVGDSCRPVIVMSHYGFKDDGQGWWTAAQKQKFMDLGKGYNIIAYIHGHNHDTSQYQWDGMDVFNSGSPYYDTGTNPEGFGHFSVYRIHGNTFEAADAGWDPKVSPTRAKFVSPTGISPKMGWRVAKTIKRNCAE
jgi:cytolysin (calcineurin-like family phosphatase)